MIEWVARLFIQSSRCAGRRALSFALVVLALALASARLAAPANAAEYRCVGLFPPEFEAARDGVARIYSAPLGLDVERLPPSERRLSLTDAPEVEQWIDYSGRGSAGQAVFRFDGGRVEILGGGRALLIVGDAMAPCKAIVSPASAFARSGIDLRAGARGAILRSAPRPNAARLGSAPAGARFEIVGLTGARHQGLPWLEVEEVEGLRRGGYVWSGALCENGSLARDARVAAAELGVAPCALPAAGGR